MHCVHCGTAFPQPLTSPRTCVACGRTTWDNPVPVVVVLVPVPGPGLLVVRRGIDPGCGRLALPGGFLEAHETWQEGAVREVREETGVELDPATLKPAAFASTTPRPDRVLLFAEAPAVAELPPFTPDAETAERGVVLGPGGLADEFAFDLHAAAAARFFAARGVTGPSSFRPG
ncbi:ADP-ribose pyrophosphatase YjhB, NUDIX family [Pseudonocardia thermophila]|uniref:ADP-ribose pyrophosphatase YjhB, NUDIX family n=1 Tax=Pseudonocardia thermophila TaxID=1848 RepID=A0A1M6ZC43_PSETH|nr:NUDIX domain-containing protein [Pseudonocardia thermophila]SHL28086.1 ADP-ribose pyrophosphatase YjhB, NUDIX family [Pseudonocardia thermophila]